MDALALTAVCDGTGEEFSVLNPHVVVTVKTQRQVLVDPSTDDEENENDVEPYLGKRSGEATVFVCKDYAAAEAALAKLAAAQGDDPVKVKLNRSDDSPLYAEAAAQDDDGNPPHTKHTRKHVTEEA